MGPANQTANSAGQSLVYNAKNQTTSIRPSTVAVAVARAYADGDQTERTKAGGVTFTDGFLGLSRANAGLMLGTTYYTRDNRDLRVSLGHGRDRARKAIHHLSP